jgi:hypothetical protein
MMRAHSALLAALCVGLVVNACGHPAPVEPAKPSPAPAAAPVEVVVDAAVPVALDQDLPRLAERATKLYQEVAQAFATTGNCAAATAKLKELQATYADVIAANAKVLHDGRARELRAALEPHAEALDASAKAIVESPAMSACSQDRAFTDSFDELVGAPP